MSHERNIFDPALHEKIRLPLLEASTLDSECYSSEEFYKREVSEIFLKTWNFVGRIDRIPEAGDYFAFEFVSVPVVIVRGRDGVVRAFANSCRHRGAKVKSGDGNCKTMSCPYHSWTYSLEGKLLNAPEMGQAVGFNPEDHNLIELRLETWDGFLFLSFDQDAESIESFLGELPALMKPYGMERMRCTRRKEYTVGSNWKIYVENAMESYHVPRVHMKSLELQNRDHNPPVLPENGEFCGLYTRHEGSRALLPGAAGFPYIQSLEGDSAAGTYYILINPSTMLACTYDCVWWFELHPLGPLQTKLIVGTCFPEETIARDDFDEIVENYYKRLDISVGEDIDISATQQIGLTSPYSMPGRFSHMEPLVHVFDNWVLDRVLDDAR